MARSGESALDLCHEGAEALGIGILGIVEEPA